MVVVICSCLIFDYMHTHTQTILLPDPLSAASHFLAEGNDRLGPGLGPKAERGAFYLWPPSEFCEELIFGHEDPLASPHPLLELAFRFERLDCIEVSEGLVSLPEVCLVLFAELLVLLSCLLLFLLQPISDSREGVVVFAGVFVPVFLRLPSIFSGMYV